MKSRLKLTLLFTTAACCLMPIGCTPHQNSGGGENNNAKAQSQTAMDNHNEPSSAAPSPLTGASRPAGDAGAVNPAPSRTVNPNTAPAETAGAAMGRTTREERDPREVTTLGQSASPPPNAGGH